MFENIRINQPNFCIGPQIGTFCSVDYENDPVLLHIRNDAGELVRTYGFFPPDTLLPDAGSSTPGTDGYFPTKFITIKYIGPRDQTEYFDGAVFYTLEKRAKIKRDFYTYERDPEPFGHYAIEEEEDPIAYPRPEPYEAYNMNDTAGYLLVDDRTEYSSNIIRRWVLNKNDQRLELDRTIIKNSNDTDWFGGDAFAVKHTVATMTDHSPRGSGQIEITTTSGLKKYDTIMLGPSTDTDNIGKIEEVYVHSVNDEGVVVVKTYEGYIPPKYDYVEGDAVTSFSDILLFGNSRPLINDINIAYATESLYGTLFHLDQTDYGEVTHREYSGIYQDITCAVWNVYMNSLSFVKGTNLLHIDLDDYEVMRSQNIGLMFPIDSTLIPLFDLDIKGITVYKLQDVVIKKDDEGQYTKSSWYTYNYATDSLVPYAFSVTMKADNNVLLVADRANITAIVRDQFGVGLINKNVWFTKLGDSEANIQPTDGYGQTDPNGRATLIYDGGYNTQQQVQIFVKVDGGNITYGSSFINCTFNLTQHNEYYVELNLVSIPEVANQCGIFTKKELVVVKNSTTNKIVEKHDGSVQFQQKVSFLYPHNLLKKDTAASEENGGVPDWMNYDPEPGFTPIIRLVLPPIFHEEPNAEGPPTIKFRLYVPKLLLNPYIGGDNLEGAYTYWLPSIPEEYSDHYISQNFISRHILYGHQAVVGLDQYIFVQEAVPAMWSEKNNVDTDYWVRLRPFASDLDPDTLVIKFSEHSYLGEGDWYEVTQDGIITMFDAGGGLLGIDFYYVPPTVFHHNAIVYVDIEVYDTSAIPNKIIVSYWFKLIPDFKAPNIVNQFPAEEEPNADINTEITFDIVDVGEGVDLDTLEVFINNRITEFDYDEFEPGNYSIKCMFDYIFHYGQTVNIVVDVKDRSANANRLFGGWRFFCADSSEPWFNMENTEPVRCAEGRRRDQDVSLQVYGIDDTGIKYDSIKVEVGGKYRNITITPIVYRLS